MSRIPLVALALAGATLAAPACGGSPKAGTTTVAAPPSGGPVKLTSGKPLPRGEWIRRGDAICARTNAKLTSISAASRSGPGRTLPQIAGYERSEARELGRLVPPASMAHDWARIVYGLAHDGDYLDTAATYVRARNFRAASAPAIQAVRLRRQLLAVARRDGFGDCARLRQRGG